MCSRVDASGLPRVSVPVIVKRVQKILDDPEVIGSIGTRLSGDAFFTLVDAFARCLPADIPQEHVRESLLSMAGVTASRSLLRRSAWRLAANLGRLRVAPVCPWNHQTLAEWSPVQICCVQHRQSHYDEPGMLLLLLFLSGTAAGEEIEKFWTKRFAHLLAGRIGFSKPWKKYPFRQIEDLYGMQFFVEIVPEKSWQRPGVDGVNVSPSQIAANRYLLQMRERDEGVFACPKQYLSDVRCARCVVGEDFCPAATHSQTFIRRHCKQCQQDGWFDPQHPRREICMTCWHNPTR